MPIDFGRTSRDYADHRAGFPDSLFDRLLPMGVGQPGQRVVDLGTGTGTLARGFARRSCTVIGIDPAATMLSEARRLDAEEGLAVDHRVARAEETGLADASADVVAAGQCWHWFDRAAATAECRRILVPGGAIAICHFDWLPWPGSVVEATETLIVEHNPKWHLGGMTGIHPQWTTDVAAGRFEDIETFSFDVDVPYSHESWRGRIRASAGIAASLDPDAVATFDEALGAMLSERFPDEPLHTPHRVWALVARSPMAS